MSLESDMLATELLDTIDARTVVQRRVFTVNTLASAAGTINKVVADDFADARKKYHAALVAKDAGIIHHVWVSAQWQNVYGKGVDDCTDWMGDDQR